MPPAGASPGVLDADGAGGSSVAPSLQPATAAGSAAVIPAINSSDAMRVSTFPSSAAVTSAAWDGGRRHEVHRRWRIERRLSREATAGRAAQAADSGLSLIHI